MTTEDIAGPGMNEQEARLSSRCAWSCGGRGPHCWPWILLLLRELSECWWAAPPRALHEPLVQERLKRQMLTRCLEASHSGTRTLASGLALLPAEPSGAVLSTLTPDMLPCGAQAPVTSHPPPLHTEWQQMTCCCPLTAPAVLRRPSPPSTARRRVSQNRRAGVLGAEPFSSSSVIAGASWPGPGLCHWLLVKPVRKQRYLLTSGAQGPSRVFRKSPDG